MSRVEEQRWGVTGVQVASEWHTSVVLGLHFLASGSGRTGTYNYTTASDLTRHLIIWCSATFKLKLAGGGFFTLLPLTPPFSLSPLPSNLFLYVEAGSRTRPNDMRRMYKYTFSDQVLGTLVNKKLPNLKTMRMKRNTYLKRAFAWSQR